MGNQAVAVNDITVNGNPTTGVHLNSHGSDWYWAVCAVMTVSTFAIIGMGLMKPRKDRVFHYITAGVTMVAAIAYFSMGSHLGWTPITIEFQRSDSQVAGNVREIYYVRYIDWFITTPLLLTDLLLTAAMPAPTIAWVILLDWVMVVTGLVGALVASSYKWGFYTFGCFAMFYIIFVLVWEGRIHANKVSHEAGRAFLMCGTLTAFLWTLYPIAWGVCEGGNVIGSDGEAIFYGILDIFAKPGFGFLLLWGHRNISPASLGLAIRDYGENDAIVNEKHTRDISDVTGVTNGTSTVAPGATGASATHTSTEYNTTTTETV